MKLVTPAYYNAFRCLAGACPDSCCKEWEVDIDPETAAYYRSLTGPLGEALADVLRTEDGDTCMTIVDGRCPMWRQDGLCRIQAELGHDALCQTCREYPRLRHDYGDFMELGLELSCPEAARLIFADEGKVSVCQLPGGDEPEYDEEAMATLLRSRETLLTFWQTSELPIQEKLAVLLMYSHSVQAELDGADPAELDPARALAQGRQYAATGNLALVFDFYRQLEILTDRWQDRLEAGPAAAPNWALLPAFVRYAVNRYWLQAVSDYDLICRVKFIISAGILLAWLGGDPVQTAQLLSKEIENAPANLERLLDGAYTAHAFTDINLLSLLLTPTAPV